MPSIQEIYNSIYYYKSHGCSQIVAAEKYNIPRSTFQYHLNSNSKISKMLKNKEIKPFDQTILQTGGTVSNKPERQYNNSESSRKSDTSSNYLTEQEIRNLDRKGIKSVNIVKVSSEKTPINYLKPSNNKQVANSPVEFDIHAMNKQMRSGLEGILNI